MMIYYTGDIHGNVKYMARSAQIHGVKESDTLVMLGDVGANYYGDDRDFLCKMNLARLGPTILCIHGNHEMRPATIPSYQTREWNGGTVWYEPNFPNLLFAKDGEIFEIDGIKHIAIGGAYSVDKDVRLARGRPWFDDEQPSDEIKAYVEEQISRNKIDIVLSHTCPLRYKPIEAHPAIIDYATVDTSTELWLDTIEARIDYKAWMCGHWHITKVVDRMYFLFTGLTTLKEFYPGY